MSLRDIIQQSTKPLKVEGIFSEAVYLRKLSGKDVMSTKAAKNDEDAIFQLVLRSLCDERGNRVFEDDELEAVKDLAFSDIQKLGEAALKFNGLDPESKEDLEKN